MTMRNRCARLFLNVGFLGLGLASGVVCAETNVDAGIDIQLERAHQQFADDGANITTVDLAPHVQVGNWDFSLDAPWISADANYVNSNFPSRLVSACSDPAAAVAKHPRLAKLLGFTSATDLSNYCQSRGVVQSGDTVSGLSDITAFARYGTLLDDQGIWLLSLGVGYKFDNGDADKNLGSGTRNTLLEASLGATYGWFVGSLTGGYAFVSGGAAGDNSHYNYASLDGGIKPADWVTLGCTVDYDQSYVATAADVTKVTAYVKFKPWEHVRLKVYARDFGNADGYPEREYGGTVSLVY